MSPPRKRRAIALVTVAVLVLGGAVTGYVRHVDQAAYRRAKAFCLSAGLSGQIQAPVAGYGTGAAPPGEVVGDDVHYAFDGFGSHVATCVVTRKDGAVARVLVRDGR